MNDPYTTANIFDLIFTIGNALIGFARVFYNFLTMPIGTLILQIGPIQHIPILGNFLMSVMSYITPFTPMDILAGGGFLAIITFVIVKKIVPVA